MKYLITLALVIMISAISCGPGRDKALKTGSELKSALQTYVPVDNGFSEYISGYTSGTIPVNGLVEIRFTEEFAAKADKKKLSGIFAFDPLIKGKAEWTDDLTLVFRPDANLESGVIYTGTLNLGKLATVADRLKSFPLWVQTLKKDFTINVMLPESAGKDGSAFTLKGELTTSDFIENREVEEYVSAKLDNKTVKLTWDHSSGDNVHRFSVENIERSTTQREVEFKWDGSRYGIKQKASSTIILPALNEFKVQDAVVTTGDNQKIDIIFSDPLDTEQELEGLVWLNPSMDVTYQVSNNIISVFLSKPVQGEVTLTVEASIKNSLGKLMEYSFTRTFDFTSVKPGLSAVGNGVIIPASENLIFPFRAANLRAVDLRIIKIFENNLPYFLQENDMEGRDYLKRFGRPVYYGKIDLINNPSVNTNKWNLFTIDLTDYINVEPGIIYKVQLGMRRSYSLYPCAGGNEPGKYEEMLNASEEQQFENWDNPDSYYEDMESYYYYDYGYNWRERNNPCNDAYFSPDKRLTRNILASNLGLMAKRGADNSLHVYVNDLRTADAVTGALVEVYDLQMQMIGSGTTDNNGTFKVFCPRSPFLVIVKKDKDRNYLKTNEASSLSLSSFDVAGVQPEKGIKGFVYGERDVWRPGDSIFLSLFVRDMTGNLPSGHPVQFELINPLGQKVDNQVQSLPAEGLLSFRTKTADDAVTGNYNAIFRIGGASFSRRVRIETIKPNRLKIDLSFRNELLGGENESETGSLSARWLNGAMAKNLKTSVEYIFRSTKTSFERYGQYIFDDPSVNYSYETTKLFDGSIDSQGNASFNFSPGKDVPARGMLNTLITARVFEQGGDASIIQKSFKYAPFSEFVGINFPALKGKDRMLFTDANNEMKIVTVDKTGRPVSSTVEVTLYKIAYRWWWESDDENLGYYISNNHYRPFITQTVTTKGGEGTFSFNVPKESWGRYLIRATSQSGHSTGKILLIDWPWDYGIKTGNEGATLLSVSTDKEKYNTGETISLSFPAPENARAIITLENSTGIVEELRVNTSGANTVVTLQAKPAMAPNVYAYITVIQPHAQTVNDMPVRLYGVVPVMVEDPATRLEPIVEAPEEVRSQQPMVIKVSEKNGKAMSYTLAVVDEGLLDITGYKTPDPWNYFYAREALGVRTWDLYNFVLGAFGGTLERIFAIGGDESLLDKSSGKAKRFIPVVRFLGPYNLPQGKTYTHSISLPQYTGSVKAMVIAGNDRSFGISDRSVFVRDPLMLLATAPRVLSPGEKVTLPVTLFIQKENINTVKVEAEGNELISFENKSQVVKADEPGEKDIEFIFTAGNKTGKATIKVTASSGNEKAVYSMEIEVRQPNPEEARAEMKILKPGEKWQKSFSPFGMEGTNSASYEVSTLPSINLGKRLSYLVDYPHGCSEQITSAAFPQIWIGELDGGNIEMIKKSNENVISAIHKLVSRQMANGGIALWPGALQPDSWVTSYTGHFMLEAEKKGFNIPSGFRQKWINYQKNSVRDWRVDPRFKYSANDQAYRLFTLALAGQPDKGAMNRLRETKDMPQLAKWLLGASFALTGREEVAWELIDVRNLSTSSDAWDYYYGSYLRDRAVILYTLTLLKNEEQGLPLLREICDNLSGEGWYSTQSVSWSLLSYMKYAGLVSSGKGGASKALISWDSDKTEISLSPGKTASKSLPMNKASNLSIENTSQGTLFMTFVQRGVPLRADVTKEDKGLSMGIEYLSMDLKPVDAANLTQGTDFLMVAKVTNTGYRRVDNIALSEMVPSGWEIRNTRLYESDFGIKEGEYDYRDIRDDRVYTYFNLSPGQTKTFILVLNASYKGEFWQPSVSCEAMYTENCYSRTPGKNVRVTGNVIE